MKPSKQFKRKFIIAIYLVTFLIMLTACNVNSAVAPISAMGGNTDNQSHCIYDNLINMEIEKNQTSSVNDNPSADNRTSFPVSHNDPEITIINDTDEILSINRFYHPNRIKYLSNLSPHSEAGWIVHAYEDQVTFSITNSKGWMIFAQSMTRREWLEIQPIVIGYPPPATHLLMIDNRCEEPITINIDGLVLTRIEVWETARYFYADGKPTLHIVAVNDANTTLCEMTYRVPALRPTREVITLNLKQYPTQLLR